MTPQIQKMSAHRDSTIDYREIINTHPWLVKKDQECILSPDSDGLLCGLFTSHYLNWKIRGFYDGKILLLQKGVRPKDCVFLDMEIFRKDVRSVGQHMILFNKNHVPKNWENFNNCLSGNNIRAYDAKHDFPQKYPLATVHLLLGVVGSIQEIKISTGAICPLLYTDGTFKNLLNYPENCLSWLKFLQADNTANPLHTIFFNDHYSVYSLMIALSDLFGELRTISGGKRGGDKIKFSNGKGELIHFNKKSLSLEYDTTKQAEKFLHMLANKTGWEYSSNNWSWKNLSHFYFKKGSIKPSQGRYNELMKKNPVSLAMTSSLAIEYTLDQNHVF